jgi:hypothetical protein
MKIYIDINYIYDYKNSTLIMRLLLFNKIIKIPVNLKKIIKEDKKKDYDHKELIKNIENIQSNFKEFIEFGKKILKWSKRTFEINKISLKIVFGTDDASQTGIVTGILWSISYSLLSTLKVLMTIKNENIYINPLFDKEYLSVESKCIIGVRPVNIIIMSVLLIIYYKKNISIKEKVVL